jgi:hypothetical protein
MRPTDLTIPGGLAASAVVVIAALCAAPGTVGADEVPEAPLIIHQIVADPVDPDRFYAITSNMGVLASLDGGRRWAHANQGLKSFTHHALLAVPAAGAAPPVLLAGGWGGGVSISRDRAATWSERNGDLANTAIDALAVDPADGSRWYAAVSTGIYRSSDGGAHWDAFGQGLPALSDAVGYKTIAIEPASGRIWLGTEGGLYRRERNGPRWTRDPDLGSARVTAVVCNPRDGRVVVGTIKQGVHVRSGRAWRRVGDLDWFVSRVVPDPVDPARLYAATRGSGVFGSVDGGATWRPMGRGVLDPDVRSLAIHPADPSRLVVGTTAAGWYYSHDRGATWRASERVAPLTMSQIVAMLDIGGDRAAPAAPPAFAKCNRCHGWTARPFNGKHTYWRMPPNARNWAPTVDRMAERAGIVPEERAAIIRFLTAYSRTGGP